MIPFDTDVAIVGAGHNGLVAAAYLARAGLRVDVFERRRFVGGASTTEEVWPGFHFSPCAQVTGAIHPRIVRDLRLVERGMTWVHRTPGLQFWSDGTYVGPESHDSPRNRAFAGRMTADERDGLARYLAFKRDLQSIFAPYRLQPPPTLAAVRAAIAGTPAAAILEEALRSRVSDIRNRFVPSGRLRDMLAFEYVEVDRDPSAMIFAYFSIAFPEPESGQSPPAGWVIGGMGTVARLMAQAAEEAGATIHVNAAVEEFLVENGAAAGLRLADGRRVRCKIVVSNLDPKRTFLKMVAPEHLDADFRQRIAGLYTARSSYKLLVALSDLPRWPSWDGDADYLYHGTIGINYAPDAVAATLDDVDAGRVPRTPIISMYLQSAVDPTVAPPGCHTASIYVWPIPSKLHGTTWDAVRDQVAANLIDQVSVFAPNFRRSILQYKLHTPLDLERELGLTDGCIWHVHHSGDQLFWNRPLPELSAYRAPIKGLYLCGAGQHPGGEVSGQPGHNAAHEVLRDHRR